MANVGDIINGKYEIIRALGKGGMSQVWLAEDVSFNIKIGSSKFWAIKEIKKEKADKNGEILLQGLIAEADLMTKLDHPMLPRIIDIIDDGSTIYVVMDYIQGNSLDKVMQAAGHPMPEDDIIDWGIQLCNVLEYLHSQKPRPIIYRDMKPGNIMCRDDGTLRLIDFGIAQEYKGGSGADTVVGYTPDYAAPEQLDRTSRSDQRTDIYNLGATLYHLVTGKNPAKPPFIKPIREWNAQLSEGLEYIIARSTQRDPANRYQSVEEMRYDLEHFGDLTEEHRRGQKRKMRLFYGSCIAALACLAVGIGCLAGSSFLKASDFEANMSAAQVASTEAPEDGGPSERERYLTAAINVDPANPEPYEAVTALYMSDQSFSKQEIARWSQLFDVNQSALQNSPAYAKICYDTGLLYFLYAGMEDGGIGTTSDERAANLFETACNIKDEQGDDCTLEESEYEAARNYRIVAEFASVVDRQENEGGDANATRLAYWNSLDEAIRDDAGANVIKLRLYERLFNILNNYQTLREFRVAGVTEDQARGLYNYVSSRMKELRASGDLARTAQEYYDKLTSRYSGVKTNIRMVYSESADAGAQAGA